MLRLHSIFESISGEAGLSIPQGQWCSFVRLQGCNLRCPYCDTADSQGNTSAFQLSTEQLVSKLSRLRNKHVLITGGEPLYQEETESLILKLLQCRFVVQVETNGTFPIPRRLAMFSDLFCKERLSWVVDMKEVTLRMLRNEQISIGSKLSSSTVILKKVIDRDTNLRHLMEDMKFLRGQYGYSNPFIISPVDATPHLAKEFVLNMQRTECGGALLKDCIISLQVHKICDLS